MGADKPSSREVLIYFLPGNPGLIEYYRTFLTHLSRSLDLNATRMRTVYHITGNSLGGFEIQHSGLKHVPPGGSKSSLFGLQEQIALANTRIQETVASIQNQRYQNLLAIDKNAGPPEPLPVILVGHSVGAYILMEAIAWRQKAQKTDPAVLCNSDFEIAGGVGLFPTVVDLAGSPRGRKAAPLAKLQSFAFFMQWIAYLLSSLPFSNWYLPYILQRIIGQPQRAAEITEAFLGSRQGVRQALFMARDELLEMTHDKWPNDVWNGPISSTLASSPNLDRPKLYFFWGQNDYWIDNSTRDKVIATRARRADDEGGEGKPYMEIDRQGVQHDFCIRLDHSRLVAEKVVEYVERIMKARK